MLAKKSSFSHYAIKILIFGFVILFHITGNINISIKTASPFLFIPLLIAFCMFSSPLKSAFIGIVLGAAADCIKPGCYCFNTIFFFLLAVAVCLCANSLVNKNIHSAIALSLIGCVLFFLTFWLFFSAFSNPYKTAISILLQHSLPSAIYSAIFIFPFYYIFKYLNK